MCMHTHTHTKEKKTWVQATIMDQKKFAKREGPSCVMHEGKLLAEGKTKEIENDEKVKEAYLGNKGITNA